MQQKVQDISVMCDRIEYLAHSGTTGRIDARSLACDLYDVMKLPMTWIGRDEHRVRTRAIETLRRHFFSGATAGMFDHQAQD